MMPRWSGKGIGIGDRARHHILYGGGRAANSQAGNIIGPGSCNGGLANGSAGGLARVSNEIDIVRCMKALKGLTGCGGVRQPRKLWGDVVGV